MHTTRSQGLGDTNTLRHSHWAQTWTHTRTRSHSHWAQTRTQSQTQTQTQTQHRLRYRQGYKDRLTCSHTHTGSDTDKDIAADLNTGSDMDVNKCPLIDWISGTLSQGYTTLQSMVMCPSHRDIEHSSQMQTWKGGAHSVLRVLGLPVAGHDAALLCANHELGGPCLRVVLQAASQAHD